VSTKEVISIHDIRNLQVIDIMRLLPNLLSQHLRKSVARSNGRSSRAMCPLSSAGSSHPRRVPTSLTMLLSLHAAALILAFLLLFVVLDILV